MAVVLVTGLPVDAKFNKLIYNFKTIFKKIQIRKFWIRELTDMYGSDCKQMTVEFSTRADAEQARSCLDNMPYRQGELEYRLLASMDEAEGFAPEYERDWSRERRPTKRGRSASRSPSPGYRREATKLDLEIELLRKQRQVIEEERRLLLERKKLEMIREYGPSASRDFDNFEPPRKRRHPSGTDARAPPRKRSPPPKHAAPKNGPRGLPAFYQPCKKLIAEMKEFINKDTTDEEKEILVKLIRAAIRKNLAIALEGKEYMPTVGIIKLYRDLHPQSTDEFFVGKILANIRASYLPDVLEGKIAAPVKIERNPKQPENSEVAVVKNENDAGKPLDKKVVENLKGNSADSNPTEPKEPASGENGKGAVEVSGEPAASEPNPSEEQTETAAAYEAFMSELAESTALPDNGVIPILGTGPTAGSTRRSTSVGPLPYNPSNLGYCYSADVTEQVTNQEAPEVGESTEPTAADDAFIAELVEGAAELPGSGEAVEKKE